jgi:alkaline phosphatase D
MIAIWDDHEVEDNYARDLPGEETPRSARSRSPSAAATATARSSSTCRASACPREPTAPTGRIPFGANAELLLLDQRQYRDDQPCGDQFFAPCTESEEPGRTYLGATQKGWLKDRLAGSPARWKIVANQAMIMALDGPAYNEINKDQWDGYAAERREILEHVVARGVKDVTFITGDIHSFFAGVVTPSGRGGPIDPPPAATEFVTGSVTSEFLIPEQGREAGGIATEAGALSQNPHYRFANFRDKGYGIVEARPEELLVTFRSPSSVLQPTAPVRDLARFRVASGSTAIEPL